jgi:hypothetical protein
MKELTVKEYLVRFEDNEGYTDEKFVNAKTKKGAISLVHKQNKNFVKLVSVNLIA